MDIDKLYRSAGRMVRRIWYEYFSRPVKNYNVENRAHKVIEKKMTAAPWHDSTKQLFDQIRKEGNFEQLNKFDSQLADRLKSVKVVSKDEAHAEASDNDEKRKRFPKDRFGVAVPYVFIQPETVPRGKITVLDALDLLLNHQRVGMTVKQLSEQYDIPEEDVEKVVKYVSVFKIVDKDIKPLNLYIMDQIADEAIQRQGSNDFGTFRDIDKRLELKKEQARREEELARLQQKDAKSDSK